MENNGQILLKWYKSHENDTREKFEKGMRWTMANLGAQLPNGSWEEATKWQDEITLSLDISKLAFNDKSVKVLSEIHQIIKKHSSYKKQNGIDAGRYLMLTIGSSAHYFAIVNAYKNFVDFEKGFEFENEMAGFANQESVVSKTERVIKLSKFKNTIETIGFVGFECKESIWGAEESNFNPYEFETIDILKNGQLRYGIYSKTGRLIAASDEQHTIAGKPAKCMWCHEGILSLSFIGETPVNGFLSPKQFNEAIRMRKQFLYNYKINSNSDIDFTDKHQHQQMELIYTSFLHPTAERLAKEWGMKLEDVKQIVKDLEVRENEEYEQLQPGYARSLVDELSPFKVIKVPESAREKSKYEPDWLGVF